ncbi:MAG: hypothetical protein QXD86_05865 [Candidatus Bathyarchaeia archaeon]
MEDLLKYLKTQLNEAEKALKDAEECLRLSELMGIDVAEAKLRFEQAKQRYLRLKSGFERYLSEKGIKV